MRTISGNGIDIAYGIDGPDGAPVVVLSHCLAADRRIWEPQIAALAKAYRVVSYDLRGHGRSSVVPPPYSMETLTADAIALLDALSVERVHFVGLSLGGMIGQAVAATAPERILSLTLCACASRVPPPELWDERIELVAREGIAALVPSTLERWFSDGYRATHADEVARIASIIRDTPRDGYIGCAHAIKGADLAGLAKTITAPTLILIGEDDLGIALPWAQEMHADIAGSRLVVLPGLRHHPNLEGADAVNELILSHLGER